MDESDQITYKINTTIEHVTLRNNRMHSVKINGRKITLGQEVYLKSDENTNGKLGPFLIDTILLQPQPTECHFRLSQIQNKDHTFVVGFSKLNV